LRHYASPDFWKFFENLPEPIQTLAKRNFELLKENPEHPSLHFKRVGPYWSVRVGLHYRALRKPVEGGILWGWIGSHQEYDKLV
jgi:hypothetical protein